MTAVSHQTIRLGKGRHSGPEHGACVMELASMLAGEPFSDRPASVSRVIGGFLRAYNDTLDDDRRQDLYDYAAKIVGSASSDAVEQERREYMSRWASEQRDRRPIPRLLRPFRSLFKTRLVADSRPDPGPEAMRALGRINDDAHAAALALIDELLAIGAAGGEAESRALRYCRFSERLSSSASASLRRNGKLPSAAAAQTIHIA